jgi:hypothetical protein
MPISCATCRETLHSHLADFIAPKNGETSAQVFASAPGALQAEGREDAPLSSTRRSEIQAHLAQCPFLRARTGTAARHDR